MIRNIKVSMFCLISHNGENSAQQNFTFESNLNISIPAVLFENLLRNT